MFTTYIAWALMGHGTAFDWWAFFATLGDRVRRRGRRSSGRDPAARARERAHGRDGDDRAARDPERAGRVDLVAAAAVLPEPVPDESWVIGGVHISKQDVGTFGVDDRVRARARGVLPLHEARARDARRRAQPGAARLLGVRTSWLLALGWGFAASLGAVSGMMVAPTVFLTPNMMQAVLSTPSRRRCSAVSRARSARSPAGSALGVMLNMLGTYVASGDARAAAARRARRPARRAAHPARRVCSAASS